MNFTDFYVVWLQHLHLLLSLLAAAPPSSPDATLINHMMTHYNDYYRVKSDFANRNVYTALNAAWLTSLERSFQWIGGWRPTTVFHLFYSVSSARLGTRLSGLIHCNNASDFGSLNLTLSQLQPNNGDMGDVSGTQLERIDRLQCETVRREDEITKELGGWKDGGWDMISVLRDEEPEIGGLVQILGRADELRLSVLKTVVEILNDQQTVEFLIAAAELQFGVRVWGMDKDVRRRGSAPQEG